MTTTTEVIEQEQVKKKEVAEGAGALILIGLIAFFFLYKPYKCPYCDEAFRTKEELDAHIAAEHPGEPVPDEVTSEVSVLSISWL